MREELNVLEFAGVSARLDLVLCRGLLLALPDLVRLGPLDLGLVPARPGPLPLLAARRLGLLEADQCSSRSIAVPRTALGRRVLGRRLPVLVRQVRVLARRRLGMVRNGLEGQRVTLQDTGKRGVE